MVRMNSADLKATAPLAAVEDDLPRSQHDSAFCDDYPDEDAPPPTPRALSALRPSPAVSKASSDADMGGSLEDLVSNFDRQVTACFKDLAEHTDTLAPVPVRSADEIMTDSQMWWTLTGNFGNLMPIDWSKSQLRKLQLPALNLRQRKDSADAANANGSDEEEDEDAELAAALDLHAMAGAGSHASDSPPQTADQVIDEIDQIMQASTLTDRTMASADSMYSSVRSPVPPPDADLQAKRRQAQALTSCPDKLGRLKCAQLSGLGGELESLIEAYNEALVGELALRDELDYEKELRNTFISLLLAVQAKRRHFAATDRRRRSTTAAPPQFMSAVVPYQQHLDAPPDNLTLQALIKILRAIVEDNSNVPNMITDYILNVVCPSSLIGTH